MTAVPFPPAVADLILGAAALATALTVIWATTGKVRRKIATSVRRAQRMVDVVAGTPAVPDPDHPGQFLRPEVPDMGIRMTAVEEAMVTVLAHATRDAQAAAERSERAAERAARDARLALKSATDLRTASEVWHADEIGVLREIESRTPPARRSTDPEGDPS